MKYLHFHYKTTGTVTESKVSFFYDNFEVRQKPFKLGFIKFAIEQLFIGATAEYPGEIEARERASRLRVKFLWG